MTPGIGKFSGEIPSYQTYGKWSISANKRSEYEKHDKTIGGPNKTFKERPDGNVTMEDLRKLSLDNIDALEKLIKKDQAIGLDLKEAALKDIAKAKEILEENIKLIQKNMELLKIEPVSENKKTMLPLPPKEL